MGEKGQWLILDFVAPTFRWAFIRADLKVGATKGEKE